MPRGVLHVERTSDPMVLKWVTHDPQLAASPSGLRHVSADAALAALIDSGDVIDVSVIDGDVLVRFGDPPDAASAGSVQAAIAADLSARGSWLFEVIGEPAAGPSVADVQRSVDAAVGPLLAAHGGSIEVVAVADDTAYVRMYGACRGCGGASSKLQDSVRAALLAAYPSLHRVVELPAEECCDDRPSGLTSLLPRIRRRDAASR